MRWLRWRRVLFLGTLNGELGLGSQGHIAIAKAKQVGLEKGAPDLFVLEPRGGYHGLAIELKHPGGGTLSPEQKVWIRSLRERGYMATCERGAASAIERIQRYLAGMLTRDGDDDATSDYE